MPGSPLPCAQCTGVLAGQCDQGDESFFAPCGTYSVGNVIDTGPCGS